MDLEFKRGRRQQEGGRGDHGGLGKSESSKVAGVRAEEKSISGGRRLETGEGVFP